MAIHPPVRIRFLIAALLLIIFSGVNLVGCLPGDEISQPSPSVPNTISPVNTELALPDLVIRSVEVLGDLSIECPAPDQSYQTLVKIQNMGGRPAGSFVLSLNLDRQLVNTILQPGDTIDVLFPGFERQVKGMVDATSLVLEKDESNNQYSHRLELPTPSDACLPTATPEIQVLEAKSILEGHTAKVWDVAFSPDGRLVASGSVDDTLRLWNVEQGKLIRIMEGHPFPVLRLKYSALGITIVTGSTDGVIRVWDVSTGKYLQSLEGHTGWITGLDVSRDGNWLVSSAEDDTVRLWRMPKGNLSQIIDEGMSGVRTSTFSRDSLTIGWGEENGKLKLRTVSGIWLGTLSNSSQPVISLAFSPDGTLLASGDKSGVIRIWNIKEKTQVQALRSHTDLINDLVFSPDGQWLVSASADKSLRLWRLEDGIFQSMPQLIFSGHSGEVTSVDFSPNHLLVVSGSEDGTVRLWDWETQ